MNSIMTRADRVIKDFGFKQHGFARLEKPLSFEFYQEWLKQSYHGSMTYLQNHAAAKADPQTIWPRAQSAIVILQNYLPHPQPLSFPLSQSRVALYARGDDYHFWLKKRLQTLIERLQELWPNEYFFAATDSQPVLERDLAVRAGLGWIGKNTCLINTKKGSLFFIGEILTSLDLKPPTVLHPDRCGTCTRCLDVCPTQALIAPRTLDARRCISYLTIEAKDDPPLSLRPLMKDWLFGCDLCQTVCPWNEKAFGPLVQDERDKQRECSSALIEELNWILLSSGKTLQKSLHGTALLRAAPIKLKRSALIVVANLKIHAMKSTVQTVQTKFPRLAELAHWTLRQLEADATLCV